MIDVYGALWGPDPNKDLRDSITSGLKLARVRCACGHVIATVYARDTEVWSVCAGTRITRPAVAANVLDSALRDGETIVRMEDKCGESSDLGRAAEVIERLFDAVEEGDDLKARISEVVAPLTFPSPVLRIDDLPKERRRLREEHPERVDFPRFGSVQPACPSCRTVWYLGDTLADWVETSPSRRPEEILASTQIEPFWIGHQTWIDYDEMDLDTLGRRLALYAHITAVLLSGTHRKVTIPRRSSANTSVR